MLAGGSYITEDNWAMLGYPDCMYLVYELQEDKRVYLLKMMENDCSPGDTVFTGDLELRMQEADLLN
jgi:hypothetical protein